MTPRFLGEHNCGLVRRLRSFTLVEHLKPVITRHQLESRAAYKRRKWGADIGLVATASRPGHPIQMVQD